MPPRRWTPHRRLPAPTNSGFFPAKQVLPGVWVGSANDVDKPDRLFRRLGVKLWINATTHVPDVAVPGVTRMRIPVLDIPTGPERKTQNRIMLAALPAAVIAMDDVLSHGDAVFINCAAGMQRSAAVAAAYAIHQGMTTDQALEAVNARKPETFYGGPTFEPALRRFELQERRAR